METFEFSPKGSFDLINQSRYFDNCASLTCQSNQVIVSFPIEDSWHESATIVFRQPNPNRITGEVYAKQAVAENGFKQALAFLSLDVDANNWEKIGQKDPVIGKLQREYNFVRPTLFRSPYEAAVSFVIGNRISIKQRQNIMNEMAEQYGNKTLIENQAYFAFPTPYQLLNIISFHGINELKINRLHNIANAAIEGILDRNYLRSLPFEIAITQLKSIPGIGEFYAQAILYRGAGIVNEITDDDLTPLAIQKAYYLPTLPDKKMIKQITANWEPYKMWCAVLLHIWLRREVGLPTKRKFIVRS